MKSTLRTWGSSLLSGLLVVFILYSAILKAPSEHLFTPSGDGLKSYYTFLYHIKHDASYADFSGMNYPYGDLFQFTDGNLPLANTLKFLGIPSPERNAIAIYNLSLIFSLPIGMLLLSLVFLNLGIEGWKNVLFSFVIMFMNPQLMRMASHLTLAYSWVIPAYILFYKRFRETNHFLRYSILFSLLGFVLLWVHPYLAVIPTGMILIALGTEYLFSLWKGKEKSRIGMAFLVCLAPLLVYSMLVGFMDTASGRSTRPFGFFEYRAELETVFAPHSGPLFKLMQGTFHWAGAPLPMQTWEGFAYIGLAVICILIFAVVQLLRRKGAVPPFSISLLIGASILLLFFSFCLPFRFGHLFNSVSNNLDFIRQFRAVGRFAWPFYFVTCIFAFYYLHQATSRNRLFVIRVLPLIAALVMFIESVDENINVRDAISKSPNIFLEQDSTLTTDIGLEQYQAIMTLPYFLIGPEYFIKEGDEALNGKSMRLSYETGLPLMSSMMSRTPVPISLKQTAMYERNLVEKQIAADFPSRSDLLVLADSALCSADELEILHMAVQVGSYHGTALYRLSLVDLFKSEKEELVQRFKTEFHSTSDGLYHKDSAAFVFSTSFEDEQFSDVVFEGKRSFKGVSNNFTEILRFQAERFQMGTEYEISFWVWGDMNSFPGTLIIIEIDPNTGGEVWGEIKGLLRFDYTRGNWHRISMRFTRNNTLPFKFEIDRPFYCDEPLYVDQCMVRPAGEEVFQVLNGKIWWNNIPLDE